MNAANKDVSELDRTLSVTTLNDNINGLTGYYDESNAIAGEEHPITIGFAQRLQTRKDQLAALTEVSPKGDAYRTQQEALLKDATAKRDELTKTETQIHNTINPEKKINAAVDNLDNDDLDIAGKAKGLIIDLAMSGNLSPKQAKAALDKAKAKAKKAKDAGQTDMFTEEDQVFLRMSLNQRSKGRTASDVTSEIYDGSKDNMGLRQHFDSITDPNATPEEKAFSINRLKSFMDGHEAKTNAIESARTQLSTKIPKITLIRDKTDNTTWIRHDPDAIIKSEVNGVKTETLAKDVDGAFTVGGNTFQGNPSLGTPSVFGRMKQEVGHISTLYNLVTKENPGANTQTVTVQPGHNIASSFADGTKGHQASSPLGQKLTNVNHMDIIIDPSKSSAKRQDGETPPNRTHQRYKFIF
jgi:hypothetical protein